MKIVHVTVAGAGQMGNQIAMLSAMAGYETICYDVSTESLGKAEAFACRWWERQVQKQAMSVSDMEGARQKLRYTNDLTDAARNADLVVEAVPDILDIKRKTLGEIDQLTPPECIYASNSSYIVASRFCDAVKDPSRVLNLHFFNPALKMATVEVVRNPKVAPDVYDTMVDFAASLGKQPAKIQKEIYGFVVNRIFSALTREACYLVDMGIADPETIDKAVKGALGHPMGPLETLDLTGLDLEYQVYMEKFRTSGRKEDLPAACIAAHYHHGEYGCKNGKGFYEYEKK